jgi:plastocyanin
MLSKFLSYAAIAGAALTFTTGSAFAEQHRILMMEQGFFPDISYLMPGDEVIFVNMSGETRNLTAGDGSWVFAEMADNSEASLLLVEGMPSEFRGLAPGSDPDSAIIGSFNLNAAAPQSIGN